MTSITTQSPCCLNLLSFLSRDPRHLSVVFLSEKSMEILADTLSANFSTNINLQSATYQETTQISQTTPVNSVDV